MASIKWLQRIIVTRQPYNGYYQTVDYSRWHRGEAGPVLLPLGETQVKAQIARPGINEIVSAGLTYRVIGSAWTGDSEITKVEFSEDGGDSWHEATLVGESVKNAWRLWQFDWSTPPRPGWRVLMARATDARGETQPTTRDPDRGTYVINHYLPIEVEIR
jgi:DMSO/TMAO reductase YedYZ molybdopterin-dependent catalytic subunit